MSWPKALCIALGAISACATLQAQAQVSVLPSAPRYQETVHLTASPDAVGAVYIPSGTTVSMTGTTITVSVQLQSVTMGEVIPPLDVVLGEFPSGSYDVNIVKRSETGIPAGSIGTAHFEVASRDLQSTGPMYDYSDLWWNPAESGWGMSLTQHASTNVFAAWFVYGSDGKPVWYIVPTGTWSNSMSYSGTVYKTTGPYYGGVFDPSLVTVTPVGSATLSFTAYDRGVFSYTIDGVTGSKTIERQPF